MINIFILLLLVFTFDLKIKKYLTFLFIIIFNLSIVSLYGRYLVYNLDQVPSEILKKLDNLPNYFQTFYFYQEPLIGSPTLPKRFLDSIQNNTIDVLPTEVSLVYFNRLNYQPRPVIQSYSAYNDYLDNLNAQFFLTQNAPEYVLFTNSTIDDRYANFDESKTKIALLQNYDLVDQEKDLFLLKRSNKKRIITIVKKEAFRSKFDQDIFIPETQSLNLMKIKTHYSTLGQLKRFFFQPPALYIELHLKNDSIMRFKAPTSILSGGVIINKYVSGNNFDFKKANPTDVEIFFRYMGQNNIPVVKVKLVTNPFDRYGFQDEIEIYSEYCSF